MTKIIPITLVGENLGKRHQYLNILVKKTYEDGEDFGILKNYPENSPIDRLFKIDLASKIKNVDYIIQNFKDDDMLFVSRALKAKWLIDKTYEDIINPQYLEDRLYPEMITTAVSKLQHWIYINLNDEIRCKQFYEHYKPKNFDLAIKFLMKCSKNYIIIEFPTVIHKISPHHFKVLCERCSQVAKIFFDLLSNDSELKSQYLNKEKDYFVTIRHLLKTDADMVLDIIERYFNMNVFNRLSVTQTKFIMSHHKKRFLQKPELYTGWLLNTKAVADSLGSEESKDLVLKLAQAKYLTYSHWFNYKSVAPLIKRVNSDERAEFKKKIFVKKDIGEEVEEWPYETPDAPVREYEEHTTIFDDRQAEPYEYEHLKKFLSKKRILKKKCKRYDGEIVECLSVLKGKTLLDKLFDEYRFASFGQTLYDLRKRIAAESSFQNREFMMLVLVSKSGGRPDAIASLMELIGRHSNEPPNARAAIIRSLVKRAQVWRLPKISWNQLLEFGQGLGLDGSAPVAECYEGLHAVVIRSLLVNGECQPSIQSAFMAQFSTLTDYTLNTIEKNIIKEMLPKMLLSITKEQEEIVNAVECIEKLVNTLNAYKIKVDTYPGLINTIIGFAEKDVSQLTYLLTRMFESKVARKQLFRYTFDLVKTDASYVNALKNDTSVLDAKTFAKYFEERFITRVDRFLTKLSLYFSESNGLASRFLSELKPVNCTNYTKELGRPLAFLLRDQLASYLCELDVLADKKSKLLGSAIRANAHVTRPTLDIKAFGMKNVGVKHIANIFLKCREIEINGNIEELLKWKRTAKLALALAKRTRYETKVFVKLAALRPAISIKLGLKLMKLRGDKVDLLIWETIKPIIQELDVTKPEKCYVVKNLADFNNVPLKIKPEYSTIIYTSFRKKSFYDAMPPLCHIEILIPDVNEQFIESLLQRFLNEDFIVEKLSDDRRDIKCTCLYIRILVKFIFLCKSEEMQKRRLDTFGDPFLAKMVEIKKTPEKNKLFSKYLQMMLKTFLYNKVFLNIEYVSPLTVMKKAVVWLQKLFSVVEHFEIFVHLHLSMLYSQAVRQSVKLAPEMFADEKIKRKEGVEVVGKLYGKYIAREVNSLTAKYFDSIAEMYKVSLLTYFELYNGYNMSSDFLFSLIMGILEKSKVSEYRLGIYLLEEKHYDLKSEHSQEIKMYVKSLKDKEAQWLAHALIY